MNETNGGKGVGGVGGGRIRRERTSLNFIGSANVGSPDAVRRNGRKMANSECASTVRVAYDCPTNGDTWRSKKSYGTRPDKSYANGTDD